MINLWIHYSSLKNIKNENQKDRDAKEISVNKAINAQTTLAILDFIKVKDISPEEVVNLVEQIKVRMVNDLNKSEENIKEMSTDYNKKLDNDIMKTNEGEDYARQN